MLMSVKQFRALRDKKNNILTLVLSEKKFLNETKNFFQQHWESEYFLEKKHNPPPIQVKWSFP
jgi:patatin-like phospholipase/acyl hydrolase